MNWPRFLCRIPYKPLQDALFKIHDESPLDDDIESCLQDRVKPLLDRSIHDQEDSLEPTLKEVFIAMDTHAPESWPLSESSQVLETLKRFETTSLFVQAFEAYDRALHKKMKHELQIFQKGVTDSVGSIMPKITQVINQLVLNHHTFVKHLQDQRQFSLDLQKAMDEKFQHFLLHNQGHLQAIRAEIQELKKPWHQWLTEYLKSVDSSVYLTLGIALLAFSKPYVF